jgi:hypothetical protein
MHTLFTLENIPTKGTFPPIRQDLTHFAKGVAASLESLHLINIYAGSCLKDVFNLRSLEIVDVYYSDNEPPQQLDP